MNRQLMSRIDITEIIELIGGEPELTAIRAFQLEPFFVFVFSANSAPHLRFLKRNHDMIGNVHSHKGGSYHLLLAQQHPGV
jgi:hypothetical protein